MRSKLLIPKEEQTGCETFPFYNRYSVGENVRVPFPSDLSSVLSRGKDRSQR